MISRIVTMGTTTVLSSMLMYNTVLPIREEHRLQEEQKIVETYQLGEGIEWCASATCGPIETTEDQLAAAISRALIAVEELEIVEPEPEIIVPSYTEEDLYVLAHVICGEAQGYSDQEQLYVGSVVLNRVEHPSFPNTIKDVVFQKRQYACTWDGNYYRTPTESNWANAQYLLENGSVLPSNVIWQAGFKQGKGVYIKTAYHYYCY